MSFAGYVQVLNDLQVVPLRDNSKVQNSMYSLYSMGKNRCIRSAFYYICTDYPGKTHTKKKLLRIVVSMEGN
jgi:hypothetical protein